jgi:hypothetical protein
MREAEPPLTGQLGVANDCGRWAIRLTRPVLARPLDDSTRAGRRQPRLGYDLVSNDPSPAHPSLSGAR